MDAGGCPVWPVSSNAELRWLKDIASVQGAQVRTVAARRGHRPGSKGTVLSIGDDTVPAAALYAHLTSRRLRKVGCVKEALSLRTPDVIVSPLKVLDDALVTFALRGKSGTCGFILAIDEASLWRQVFVRSAAVFLGSLVQGDRVDLLTELPCGELSAARWRLLGAQSTPEGIRSALSSGVALLNVSTHSDGIDAFLSDELVLCSTIANLQSVDIRRRPACATTGQCVRVGCSVSQASANGKLLSVEAISAGVLLWNACSGILNPAAPINPEWGLGAAFIKSSHIGAVVTSFGISAKALRHEVALADHIAAGATIGRSLALLRQTGGRQVGAGTILIGDPRVRVNVTRTAVAPLLERSTKHSKKGLPVTIRNIALFRALLGSAVEFKHGGEERKGLAQNALLTVLTYERRVWSGGSVEKQGAEMRQALIAYLRKRGRFLQDWAPFSRVTRNTRRKCRACGGRCQVSILKLELPDTDSRQLVICSRCGIVEDTPADSTLTFKIGSDGRLLLSGKIRRRWAGAVLVWSQAIADGTSYDWPADEKGWAARELLLPPNFGVGSLNLALILIHDTKLYYLNCHELISPSGQVCRTSSLKQNR